MQNWTRPAVVAVVLFVLGAMTPVVVPNSIFLFEEGSVADTAILAEHRIEPTRHGVSAFFHQLKTEFVEAKEAKKLIPQLGDEAFLTREEAMRRLIDGPALPLNALRHAAAGLDREIASRAQQILSHPKVAAKVAAAEGRPRIAAAVLRTLQTKSIQGTTPALFDLLPHLEDRELLDLACEVMAEVASPADLPFLEQSLANKNLNVRIAAIRGLANAKVELRAFLEDAEPRLVLATAHSLSQRGDRTALPVLARLASCKEEQIRARCEQILRAWTGRNFGFDPYQNPETQEKALARWRDWIAAEGGTAKLNVPIRLAYLPEDLRKGLLLHYTFDQAAERLLTDGSGNKRHGTPHNEHSQVTGVTGKALEVRGVGDMGDQGGHALLPFIDFMALEQFTVSLWVYERGMTNAEGEAYIVFGADRTVGIEDSLGISHFNNDLFFRVGGAHVRIPYGPMDRNRWIQYALTFQDGRLCAYKEGRLVGEAKGRVQIVGKQAALGRHWWHHGEATSTRLLGAFDEVRIYQRALSPVQLERLSRHSY